VCVSEHASGTLCASAEEDIVKVPSMAGTTPTVTFVFIGTRVLPRNVRGIRALSRVYSVPLGMGRMLTSARQSAKERGFLSALIAPMD
jgi:hypothetical protein